jgi:putative sugar O-methyltransferase
MKNHLSKIIHFLLSGKPFKNNANRLTIQQQAVLSLMRQDNDKADLPFKASEMWSDLQKKFDQLLRTEGINKPENQFLNTFFFESQPGNPRYYRYALWMLYKETKKRDIDNILEKVTVNTEYNKDNTFIFDGYPISWDLLITVDTLYSIKDAYPTLFIDPVTVVDLGAGWGRIGYILKQINPKATYIALDLPEPLLISMTRLPQLLPHEKIMDYQAIQEIPNLSRSALLQAGLWFGGSQDLARFEDGSIDIFINISSFQEMTQEQVVAYFEWVNHKVSGIFYLQQYWAHPGLHKKFGTIEKFEDYPFLPGWNKLYVRNITYSERYFEAAFRV